MRLSPSGLRESPKGLSTKRQHSTDDCQPLSCLFRFLYPATIISSFSYSTFCYILCFFHFQSYNPQYLTFYINNIAKRRFINVKLSHSALFLLILQLIMPNKQRNSWLIRHRTKETNKNTHKQYGISKQIRPTSSGVEMV